MIDLNWYPKVKNAIHNIRTNPLINEWVIMFNKYNICLVGKSDIFLNTYDNDNRIMK